MTHQDFFYRDLPVINKRVHRLGLAFNWLNGKGAEAALSEGLNYLFWQNLFKRGEPFEVLKQALKRDRENYVLASGAAFGYFKGGVRRGIEKMLRLFDVAYFDVYQLFWLGRMSLFSDSVQQELVKIREEGLARSIGISIHDRPRAGRLVTEADLDLFMIRYNAAHPGAEQDIFPAYEKRRPLTVSYTATSWRKLLKPVKGWDGPVMTASDCYRFCLSSPHVDVCLCGPANAQQLQSNLEGLKKGPLSEEEDKWMREFGRVVHG